MLITDTDREVYKFLEKHNLFLTAKQASRLFYKGNGKESSNLLRSQKRLKNLVEKDYIKATDAVISKQLIYYTGNKPPKIILHKYYMVEFLIRLAAIEDFEIIEMNTEFKKLEKDYHIRPDLFIRCQYKGRERILFVEVDISKGFSNMDAYRQFYEVNNKYIGNTFVISICDDEPKNNDIGVLWYNTEFENIENLQAYL